MKKNKKGKMIRKDKRSKIRIRKLLMLSQQDKSSKTPIRARENTKKGTQAKNG